MSKVSKKQGKGQEPYCKPWNAGLASETPAVARKLGKMFDAMEVIDRKLVDGDIVEDLRNAALAVREHLEAEGWTVSTMNGNLEGGNRWRVYPPGSPTGAKVRKWRESR